MAQSLDRLIDLAKKTGDRLIIHDPSGERDIVLMDIDSYEHLVLGRRSVKKMSEGELLDQINRDIAVWQANREFEEGGEEDVIEEAFEGESPWKKAGDVLQTVYTGGKKEEPKDMPVEEVITTPIPKAEGVMEPVEGEALAADPIFYEEPV
ncbi:MAG TPA: hypothetical protein VEA18_00425 [Candidatus Kapabacteria bacterium]|nr:hypothetical protein [Candidatus Kapabacteria bacterium]